MQAREQGGGFEGAKDGVLAKRKGKDQKKFFGVGESNDQKRSYWIFYPWGD